MPIEQLSDIRADSIALWIEDPRANKAIRKEFKNFLLTHTDGNGISMYGPRIEHLGQGELKASCCILILSVLCETKFHGSFLLVNSESLEVSYMHLADAKPVLAYFLTNSPSSMFPIFDAIALEVILLFFPLYTRIHAEVHVRITEVPTAYTLRDLRQVHLDALVRVTGVVTRRGGVLPQLKYVKFDCGKCGEVLGPFHQDATKEVKISFCSSCTSKGPFTVNSEQVSPFPFEECYVWSLILGFVYHRPSTGTTRR